MLAFLVSSIRLGMAFLFGSTGETITEKSGHLNLGIPGVMCVGASCGCFAEYLYLTAAGPRANYVLAVLIPVIATMLGGALIALVGTAGDLVESRFKREFGVKDSATFMPAGQGGFLDMFDSILFIPAIAYPIIAAYNR